MANNASLPMLLQSIEVKKVRQEVTIKNLVTHFQKENAIMAINASLTMTKL